MASDNPIVIHGIDHVVLRVRDVARMQRFYCEVLGCTVEKVQAEIGLTQLRAGRSLIDLVDVAGRLGRIGGAPPGAEGRNMDHLCLRVERLEDPAIPAHLAAHGVEPGEIVRRYGAEGSGPSMYITDPEGNTIELKGPPSEKPA
jgi:catechol 2,3-dioxygenase-like lactoylglutathione lyase family enzyme